MKKSTFPFILAALSLAVPFSLQAATFTVTNLSDDGSTVGSLRWAILQANLNPNLPADTIEFDSGFFSTPRTIVLSGSELPVLGPVTVNGPGMDLLTISGNDTSRVFKIGAQSVELRDLTAADGRSIAPIERNLGAGILNDGGLRLTRVKITRNTNEVPIPFGGGIYNRGTLEIVSSIITGNELIARSGDGESDAWGEGGGIYNAPSGTLTVTGSVISANTGEASSLPAVTVLSGRTFGMGIFNAGSATIDSSTISGNAGLPFGVSPGTTGWAFGSGIYNSGTLTIRNGSRILDNIARPRSTLGTGGDAPQPAFAHGAGLYNTGDAEISDTIFANNLAEVTVEPGGIANGAAIHNTGGSLTLRDCVLDGNRAQSLFENSSGGGLFSESGNVELLNCAVINNSSVATEGFLVQAQGGGIGIFGGNFKIENSTIVGNTCSADADIDGLDAVAGGGVFVQDGTGSIRNVTIAANELHLPSPGRISDATGAGMVQVSTNTVELANTLILGNAVETGFFDSDLAGTVASLGFNITGHSNNATGLGPNDTTGASALAIFLDGNTDGSITPDDLEQLPSPTLPLSPVGPAANAGSNALIPIDPLNSLPIPTDQRGAGFPRIVGGTVDIGAREEKGVIFVDATATGSADGLSWVNAVTTLQEALSLTTATGFEEIRIARGTYVPSPFAGGSDDPQGFTIEQSMALLGGFASGGSELNNRNSQLHPTILDADGTGGRVLTVADLLDGSLLNVTLDGFRIRNGDAIEQLPGSRSGKGGGLYTRENLTLRNTIIESNQADSGGGGIYAAVGFLLLENCQLIGNSTLADLSVSPPRAGGAIRVAESASVLLRNTEVLSNQGAGSSAIGGAIITESGTSFDAHNSCFSGNFARSNGGGGYANAGAVNAFGGSLHFFNCLFSGNAGKNGGAINLASGSVGDFVNCTFAGNYADGYGGAVVNSGTLSMSNCVLWGNRARFSSGGSAHSVSGTIAFNHCLVEFLDLTLNGPGNLDGTASSNDPLFIAPLSPASAPSVEGLFTVLPGSSIIDAGDNSVNSFQKDLAGGIRVQNGVIDLGAYEGARDRFTLWIAQQFPGQTDPEVIDFTADPNKDGVSNWQAFLLGADADLPVQNASPRIEESLNHISYTFQTSQAAAYLNPQLEFNFGLDAGGWENIGALSGYPGIFISTNLNPIGTDQFGFDIVETTVQIDRHLYSELFHRRGLTSPGATAP